MNFHLSLPESMLPLNQLLRVPHVDPLFDISPDNSKLAFSWNQSGEWQIYEMLLPSPTGRGAGGEGKVTQLTFGGGGKFNPRYSPDGSRLAYVMDADGSESYRLVVYNFAARQHTDLTPGISHALQPNFCWSPEGSRLAFLSDEQGHFSAYVISAQGGEPQLALDTGHPAWQVEWSPDGRHLAVCCEMQGQDYGIFIVDLAAREVVQLPLNAGEPQWPPQGGKLAFQSDERGWFDIGLYDLSTRQIEWLTQSEGDSQLPAFASRFLPGSPYPTHPTLAYTQSKGAVNWLEIASREGSRKTFEVGKGVHGRIRLTSDAKRAVTTFSSPRQPADLWLFDVESGTSLQLTNSLAGELSSAEFPLPEEIEYPGMDGAPVPALLYRPKQTPAPAVVMVHGGPNWHYAAEWNPVMAHLASRGYAVLAPNYRGSTGYGRAWQYAARFDLGGVDADDVAAGAQYLLREGLASRAAVTGRSHGGYLTMVCLTRFPGLWCAGSAVAPFTNWFKSHAESREDLQHWNIENMGDPAQHYERWYNASPYFFLERINAPVQMICGGRDPRCPASDSLETRDKLVELGRQVEFHLYEDEGHSFLKSENVLDAETKRVEFLAKALEA